MKLALALLVAAASAFAPAPVAPRATRLRAETADYASMDVDALEKIIEESRRKLLDLRLEKRQQSKKAQFKSSELGRRMSERAQGSATQKPLEPWEKEVIAKLETQDSPSKKK